MQAPKRSQAGRPKSTEKRQQILNAASDIFLDKGFVGTSMDNVATAAGVSKQTVYSHFSNKEALFSAVIKRKAREYKLDEKPMQCQIARVKDVLRVVGTHTLELFIDRDVNAMYRTVIGDAVKNQRVAELFYEAGPKKATDVLAQYLVQQQEYPVDQTAADWLSMAFFSLMKGDFHMMAMLCIAPEMTSQDKQETIDEIVDAMMVLIQHKSSQHQAIKAKI